MPNILTLTVEEPDKILNAGAYGAGAVMRLQSATTEAGAYADVAGTGSTPTVAIVAGTRAYDGYDPAGTVSTWYRTRFENAGATRLSDWSDPFQVAPEGSGLICALWDVKQDLGQTSASPEDETILEKIRQVTTEIQGYTGRQFVRTPASGTTTFTFDIRQATRTLWVPKGIATLTQVEIATQTGGAYTVVPSSDWFLDPPETERDYGWPGTRVTLSDTGTTACFYPGKRTVRLTMALGWDSVPADVAGIGQRASIAVYLSKGSGAGGVAAIGPTGNMTVLRNISPADRATLDRYRVVNV